MCGIAGVIQHSPFTGPENLAPHFLRGLHHRGPDFSNYVQGEGYLLMHTRLSIIDLNSRANQPFESSDGRYTIVFNGEIYNYGSLKSELQHLGYPFRTTSDTEVLLNAFICWKEDALNKLDGFFAFAIYDKVEKKLFLARDRVGKKPLFYYKGSDCFCFASESDVIASSGLAPKKLSLPGINCFLALGYILEPGSLYEGIYQLKAGHYIWLDEKALSFKEKEYWDVLSYYENKKSISLAEATESVKYLLTKAVQKRLLADVEIAVFLSGGIDSAIIATLAGEHQKNIKTFTAAFKAKAFDERGFAQATSAQIKSNHLVCEIAAVNQVEIERVIDQSDGVLADTAILALNPLCQFASQYVKVVLSGDGADELFGGYATYKASHLKRRLKLTSPLWPALQKAGKFFPLPGNRKVSISYQWDKFFGSGKMDALQAHYHFREHHSISERIAILGKENTALINDTDPLLQFRKLYNKANHLDDFEKLLYIDFKTWLVDDILVKTDRAGMAWGLEIRCPYLDKDLVEFVASVPAQYKTTNGFRKELLRNAFKSVLPVEILNRKKSGFNVPLNLDTSGYSNEYKFFNDCIYKHKIDGQYSNSGF